MTLSPPAFLIAAKCFQGVSIIRWQSRIPPRSCTSVEIDCRTIGPIGAQSTISIGGDTTAGDVYAETARLAPELIDGALANESFSPQAGETTYAEKIGPADRELDWSRPPKELHDRIRALSPHIGARGELHGRVVTVWRSQLAGDRLEVLEVQPEGGTRMPYEAWLRGLRSP